MGTVVFTDVEGSTRLLRALGPAYEPLLEEHFEVLRSALVDGAGGRVVNVVGDGLVLFFDDAGAAVDGCRKAQQGLAAAGFGGRGLRVRMGVHSGDVRSSASGEAISGLVVHQAARVAATGHGGQIVCSSATAAAVRAEGLRELGQFQVRDFDTPERLFEASIPGAAPSPPLRARPAAGHNLPPARTSFVGREAELEHVGHLLGTHRVVTLTGPGGTGKTRLAEEVVRRRATARDAGAVVIGLGPLEDADLVAARVASALGVHHEFGRPLVETIVGSLSDRDTLILLDNCEHVVSGVRAVVNAVLDGAPAVTVLATSRRAVGVAGEVVVALEPLAVPGPDAAVSDVASNASVLLLQDRAFAAGVRLALDADSAAGVARLCRLLDGLPLAVELAAPRLRSLSVATLADRIETSAASLASEDGDSTGRQATMQALVSWSLELLDDAGRALARRLSVFRGGFELASAEAVAGNPPLTPGSVLAHLDGLVGHSLVAFDPSGAGRYRMLRVIRDVLGAELAASGEREVVFERHLSAVAEIVRACTEQLTGPAGVAARRRLDGERDNVAAALSWAAERPGGAAVAADLAVSLGRYWEQVGMAGEGLSLLEDLLDTAGPDRRGRLLYAVGILRRTVDPQRAEAPLEEAVVLLEAGGEHELAMKALGMSGVVAMRRGAYPEAEARLARARELAAERADGAAEASWVAALANAARYQGRDDEAWLLAEEAVLLAERAGADRERAAALIVQAELEFGSGRLDLSAGHLRQALEIAEREGDRATRANILGSLGNVAVRRGEPAEARVLFEEAVLLSRTTGDRFSAVQWTMNLGVVAVGQGQLEAAAASYEQALAGARSLGAVPTIALVVGNLGQVRAMRGDNAGASEAFTEALELARQIGDVVREASSLANLGNLALLEGDVDGAAAHVDAGLEVARRHGLVRNEAICAQYLAQCAIARGELDEAVEWGNEAVARSRAAGDRIWEVTNHRTLCRAHRLAGDRRAADTEGRAALELCESVDDLGQLAACHAALAAVASSDGDRSRAVEHCRAALASIEVCHDPADVTLEAALAVDVATIRVRLVSAAQAWQRRARRAFTPEIGAEIERALDETRRALGNESFEREYELGAAMDLGAAAAWAVETLEGAPAG